MNPGDVVRIVAALGEVDMTNRVGVVARVFNRHGTPWAVLTPWPSPDTSTWPVNVDSVTVRRTAIELLMVTTPDRTVQGGQHDA